ncbi:MAG TPA: arginine--tRNA ligase, partial [bacterium]|nr:arginine--tRNA ligase [bacterium]
MTTKDTIKQQIKQVLDKKYKSSNFQFSVNYPPVSVMGDYSVNAAMLLAKDLKRSPFELAKELVQELGTEKMWQKVVAIKPGFINFYLSEKFLQENLKNILKAKEKFGQIKPEKKEKIMLEFISANPTGPLTLANGRGGFTGDVLANVLAMAGNAVKKEYYVNDVGNQINILGHSVLKDAQAQYKGEYIDELKKEIKATDPNQVGQEAAQIILKKYIQPVIKKAGIEFDNFFAESELHDSGSVEK